ncbi:uncharacterized protein TNCV_5006381 [Trichonephila clavipes]|uniref:Uncharacterized protein n=1 Tax=Trichonephila clavipes TaxID=2585209 RepID=A0A8X6SCA0_TRICX|nr:uncharacterized protein TNCV_5006381 [Trichonephila clavipes]
MDLDDEIAFLYLHRTVGIYCVRSSYMKTHWAAASARFTTTFVNNPFGHKCDVYARLWFLRSLKPTKEKHLPLLSNTFPKELVPDFKLCSKPVLDESRSFFRVHTGYFSNIPKCIKAEFIASWGCSQSSVVSSSQR